MHTNRLQQEKSPYLLQHAHNPVDWFPWGEAAFEKARSEDKPIFLSIGYSTCHWCHVMERESFESEPTAEILNRDFVCVKVDREERPDIDRIYMTFVQATTGSGGWPMSVWLTPDLKPFFGGTYFPPDNRYGRPGFPALLEYIAATWKNERQKVLESGDDVLRQLSQMMAAQPARQTMDESGVESCFLAFRRSFDSRLGGFGQAPKFPRPVQLNFLFRYYERGGNEEALEMATHTLKEMYKGGMYDQLGGGFHRYSVDARWFVPHFEKMLYDQAQLAISAIEALQITREPVFEEIARQTLDYVLRDMTDARGGFHSAEDADSVIDPADPKHKGEGAFYIFTAREIEEALRKPEADWFSYRYGVEPGGNVIEDPHREFTGRNILYQAHTIEETARQFGIGEAELKQALSEAQARLMQVRGTRVRPHLDDKVLTAWNGLMISAFAKASQVLGDGRYLAAAQTAAGFVEQEMYRYGMLLRRYRDHEAAIEGFLDDYAFYVQALLDLYEADFRVERLDLAVRLTETMLARFQDHEQGAFFSTAEGDPSLVLRMKDDYDGAEPSANSVAALNLLRLARITGRKDFQEAAEATLRYFAGRMNTAPVSVPQMLVAFMFHAAKPRQIILAGAGAEELLAEARKRFLPNAITLWLDRDETRDRLAQWNPAVAEMRPQAGRAAAYVCENFTCQLPVTTVDEFAKLL
ncbi:MAG: thioredoxin domain-containing protein [Bryobacteraceae bacterium]|nr:thioredoxin domain-containing protein [Bryobacteraceae bacterium]